MPNKLIPLVIFNLIYLSISAFYVIQKNNVEFMIYYGVVVGVGALLIWFYRRWGLSVPLLWGFSLWGLAHLAGGLYEVPASWPTNDQSPVLYNWWIIEDVFKFDNLVHTFGFAMSTWLVWEVFRSSTAERYKVERKQVCPTGGILFVCVLAGMGLGAINEIVEFAVTLTVPEVNVGGYINTGWDLVANAVGATVTAILIRIKG